MSKLSNAARKKNRKKQNRFQKLWAKAERVRQRNQVLQDTLDALMIRLDEEVRPQELQLARVHRDIAMRLIESQNYKSLSSRERREIDNWAQEISEELNEFGLLDDELRDALARNGARAMGITLDENSELSVEEQIAATFEAQMDEDLAQINARKERIVKQQVEQRIHARFGKRTPSSGQTQDMFQAELDGAEKAREEEIAAFRESVEKEIREQIEDDFFDIPRAFRDLFGDNSGPDAQWDEDNWSDDAWDNEEDDESAKKTMPAQLRSDVFKRLFRQTANALHPDKEREESRHAEKQQLMSQLLNARKHGDLLTLFQMHRQYVGTDIHLDASDEKQLLEVLEFNLEALYNEELEITRQSPAHLNAYTHFYAKSKKAMDRRIRSHLNNLADQIEADTEQLSTLRTLKNIKLALQDRRFDHRFDIDISVIDALATEFSRYR